MLLSPVAGAAAARLHRRLSPTLCKTQTGFRTQQAWAMRAAMRVGRSNTHTMGWTTMHAHFEQAYDPGVLQFFNVMGAIHFKIQHGSIAALAKTRDARSSADICARIACERAALVA